MEYEKFTWTHVVELPKGEWKLVKFVDLDYGMIFYPDKEIMIGYKKDDVFRAYLEVYEERDGPTCPDWCYVSPPWDSEVWIYVSDQILSDPGE